MVQFYLRSRSLKCLFSSPSGRRFAEEKASSVSHWSSGDAEPKESPAQKPTWRCFSYEEIHKATSGFHQDNLVGRGGYADVYRGELENGMEIAVKKLTRAATDEQKEKDFLTELGTVGHVRHPNVTALLGCCIDRDLHLIFEFSSHGSISMNLHDESSPPMAWKLRWKVAAGTARGLHYLHKECQRRIIHRDIKASNVLLSADFEPKISDFGLAKWLPSEWTHHAIAPIEGTFGCLAPEYFTHGIVDEKTDVFAFGVFLLEIMSGKKPVDGSHKSLLSWAKPYMTEGRLQMLVDPKLSDDYAIDQLNRLSFIASLCVRASAAWRPTMTEVLQLIEGGELSPERWKMPEEAVEQDDEFWGFDDLDECQTPTSSTLSSVGCS
ncbi:putative receptor-like serine/threonine-protein kinase [Apostasia shenzhenica]|uniref:Putative receptor-like serine/threonine-protein kinase n=1 Tax=Apostasia shenzhenica TaxID=1088818 RepID=A0A2I0A771_9ASPA|nr:putative receptor-like serine/threonine-protein kinase [Apostasia shenzhenica]